MADQDSENKQIEKLKELEQSLAKELDTKVTLSEASDPRLDGSVVMNPELAHTTDKNETGAVIRAAPPAPKPDKSGKFKKGASPVDDLSLLPGLKKVDDISLKDVDEMLNEIDADFNKSLSLVMQDGPLEYAGELESISISKEYLGGDEGVEEIAAVVAEVSSSADDKKHLDEIFKKNQREAELRKKSEKKKTANLMGLLFEFSKQIVIAPIKILPDLVWRLYKSRKLPLKKILAEIMATFPATIAPLKEATQLVAAKFKSYRRAQYLSFFGMLGGLFLMSVLWQQIKWHMNPTSTVKDPFVASLGEVSSKEELVPEDDGEELEGPNKHPEFTVFLNQKIIANLRPPNPRRTPMAMMEIFVEASNQESAVEIKARQSEVKDLIQRITEDETFEVLDTMDGKQAFKIKIRNGINRILNHGHVKRIFFKTFYVKA